MKTSIKWLLFIILIAVLFLGGFYYSQKQKPEKSSLTALQIGYQPSTHQIAEMTAWEKGWWQEGLAKFGIKEITEKEFIGGAPEMTAMLSGEIDVAYVGATPPLSAIDKGLDAKIVAAVQTNGSSLILKTELSHKYSGPSDLKGLKIAIIPTTSVQEAVLIKWLKDNNVDPKEIDLKSMGGGEAVTAMKAGAVDGAFLHEPYPSIIELEGSGKIVLRSSQMWENHPCCVLLISGRILRDYPEVAEEILSIHKKATEYNTAHPDEAAEIFSRKVGLDLGQVKYSLETWDGQWIADPNPIIGGVLEFAKIHFDLDYIKKLLTESEIFDASFWDKLAK